MGESIMRPLILIVTFISLFTIVVTAMAPIFYASDVEKGRSSSPGDFAYIAGQEYELWYPEDGYAIGADNVTHNSYAPHFDTNELVFWEDGGEDNTSGEAIKIWIMRNNDGMHPYGYPLRDHYEDPNNWEGFIIYRHKGWWDEWYDEITFDELVLSHKENSNESRADFVLDVGYTLFVINATGVPLTDALDTDSDYKIGIGWTWYNSTMAAQSAFDVIIGIMTFNLPNVHWVITAILAIPIYTSIAFMMFIAIIRVIPFIGE